MNRARRIFASWPSWKQSFQVTKYSKDKAMGYTHYFKMQSEPSELRWSMICADFIRLLKHLPDNLKLAGPSGKAGSVAQIAHDQIVFNGLEPDDYESMIFNRYANEANEPLMQFCKTARKPYDLVVCALLIVAHNHAPDCWTISSDGDPEDWEPALKWVHEHLGENYVSPI